MFTIDLRKQVPVYKDKQPNWGGAACCQMAMEGYPPGATSCYIDQSVIWKSIQANNLEPGIGPWGIGWYADPYAVTKTLNTLCPPQHKWIDVSGTDKNKVLYTLLRYMANYKYASLICVWAHDYWNVLVHYVTSDDPRNVANPSLVSVGIYEPTTGNYKQIDGSVWMTSPYYWGMPCDGQTCGKKWNNMWIGIGEPPEVEGAVRTETVVRTGQKMITPEEAVKAARRGLDNELQRKEVFLERHLGLRAGNAMLFRELPRMLRPGPIPEEKLPVRCYLVPFSRRYEVNEEGAATTRLSVSVNAYTGKFEEMTLFATPIHYLSAKEAAAIVARNLHLSHQEASALKPELVAYPIDSLVSSAVPAWSVMAAGHTIYVTQSGQILGSLFYPACRGA